MPDFSVYKILLSLLPELDCGGLVIVYSKVALYNVGVCQGNFCLSAQVVIS